MNISKVLKEELKLIEIDKNALIDLKKETNFIVDILKEEISKKGVNADVYIGGSFAKGTLVKKKQVDIDIFVRFDWRIDDISNVLEKIVKSIGRKIKCEVKILHGSRDYFRIEKGNILFEIIPVCKIRKPKEARNVTDLSYFHVNYVKKKLKNNLTKEVLLAKKFCHAQGVYGAESYIQGFSGYGLECLIINYKSFLKMIKELSKVEDRLIIDPEKNYKNKNDILFSLNESKLQSPVILVDPTWKERNVLAALSRESFKKFQEKVKEFLKRPSRSFFEIRDDIDKLKRLAEGKDREFVHLEIETDRQEGDIAGTKMKKFAKFLENELRKYFNILNREFLYSEGKKSDFYLVAKKKNKIVIIGPPVKMKNHAKVFRQRHKKVFEKSGRLYSEIKVDFSAKEFLEGFGKENKIKIWEMGIVGMKIQ